MNKKNDPTKVSIIITAYNQSKLLKLAVESALAQTYPAIEIIVIDDGSTDGTPEMMEQFAGQLTYIWQENQGPNNAVYKGFDLASGEYIGFLDHDDLYMPTKIEKQVKILDSRPDVCLVNCGFYLINENGKILWKILHLPQGHVLKELVHGTISWAGGPLFRKKYLDEIGKVESYCPDWETMLLLSLAGRPFASIPEPLGKYRMTRGSMMTNPARLEQAMLEILDRVFADPRLPAEVVSVKDAAYFNYHFEICYRYFLTGLWDKAHASFSRALEFRPDLKDQPKELLRLFLAAASDARIEDPVKFVNAVFDHLPTSIEYIQSYRPDLLSQIYVNQAMKEYAKEEIDEAKRYLSLAVELAPVLIEQPDEFGKAVIDNAINRGGSTPDDFVERVFRNLPQSARAFEKAQSNVRSKLNIACAFDEYAAGRKKSVAQRILRELFRHPAWLMNRGVVSILLKSLPSLLVSSRNPN